MPVFPEAGLHHQFFPSATIDPVTGFIYIAFHGGRFNVGNATD